MFVYEYYVQCLCTVYVFPIFVHARYVYVDTVCTCVYNTDVRRVCTRDRFDHTCITLAEYHYNKRLLHYRIHHSKCIIYNVLIYIR